MENKKRNQFILMGVIVTILVLAAATTPHHKNVGSSEETYLNANEVENQLMQTGQFKKVDITPNLFFERLDIIVEPSSGANVESLFTSMLLASENMYTRVPGLNESLPMVQLRVKLRDYDQTVNYPADALGNSDLMGIYMTTEIEQRR